MPTFVTSDGVEIRYEVRGTGPPVLVLHGGPNNVCDTLLRDVESLTDSFTLVFHDYRGSGRSATASPETYRFERLADDLDELRAHLGLEQAAVLAHSMGGFIALLYALRHTDNCDRLALVGVSACGQWKPMLVPTLRALGPLRITKALAMMVRFGALWSWRRPSAERTAAMYAPMSVTQEARLELRPLVAAAHPELPIENPNADELMAQVGDVDLRPQLVNVRCPVLVLYGDRDATMTAAAPMLAAGLTDVQVRELPGVGHEPFIEEPTITFTTIRRFLAAPHAGAHVT
jgi:pimeloyl-ACP methyl ester carboxylesterase